MAVAKKTRKLPEHHHTVTPWLSVQGADAYLTFCKKVFRAKVTRQFRGPDGKTLNAAFLIGDSLMAVAEESASMGGASSPLRLGGVSTSFYVYVDDVDAVFKKALAAGVTTRLPPADMFWGDRIGSFTDPCGYMWSVATHKEDVSPDEMQRRAKAWQQKQQPDKGA
jgi:uncharacterized glyoxalase superfamily protein PhnB